ncbi:MAG: 5-formyltetrahydrofolate cyclo-ligase [Gammaproteobacteria bacterium]|nr:5-formyltetrahydrofolate cyclo-ligase [Gammaproteobacteria bacterium]MCW5582648.1 5-formyltetrahydrofolate cyclo-ligase [Gammaproteobacteria bacterium]
MQPSNTETKLQLRKYFREIRSQIKMEYRQYAAQAANLHFTHLPMFKQSQHIACYLYAKDEFDASPIIQTIWQSQKACYLPILTGSKDNSLLFSRYNDGDALHLNRYSILEPADISHVISPENLDMVITPLVAFDLQGHRLGAGGGYYDRTFAFLRTGFHEKPYIIGLAYAAQQADLLPSDSWDVPLNGMVTEKASILFSY